jgi:hypothetical protein
MPPATPPKIKPPRGDAPRDPPQNQTPAGSVHPKRPPGTGPVTQEIPLDFPVITVKRVAIITYSP